MRWGAGQLPGQGKTKEIVVSPGPFEGAMSVDLALGAWSCIALLEPWTGGINTPWLYRFAVLSKTGAPPPPRFFLLETNF